MKTIAKIALKGSLLLSIFATSAGAATFTTNAFSDAFVTTGPTGNLSGDNFGGAGALSVAAPGLGQGEFQSVLQFDLSGAMASFNAQYGAGQWTVQSVTLQLTSTANNNAIFNTTAAGQFGVSLMQNNSWTEGTGTPANPTASGITFNSLQSTFINASADQALGTFSFNGSASGASSFSLNLTSGILADLQGGDDLSLRMYAADSMVSYLSNSRSGGSSMAHPELIIVAAPEPSCAAICLMGLAAFWLRRAIKTARP